MTRMWIRWQTVKNRAGQALASRRDIAGVEVTGETIGWLIAAIVLVGAGVIFASGAGTTWMHQIFGNVTSIRPTGVPTSVTTNG